MTHLHVLLRKISPYTDSDFVIGIYNTEEKARLSLDTYFEKTTSNPEEDKWHKQAYKEKGLCKEDLMIQKVPYLGAPHGSKVYLISDLEEAFGQENRLNFIIAFSKEDAEKEIERRETKAKKDPPQYWAISSEFSEHEIITG